MADSVEAIVEVAAGAVIMQVAFKLVLDNAEREKLQQTAPVTAILLLIFSGVAAGIRSGRLSVQQMMLTDDLMALTAEPWRAVTSASALTSVSSVRSASSSTSEGLPSEGLPSGGQREGCTYAEEACSSLTLTRLTISPNPNPKHNPNPSL